ncbi:MAG: PilZ domain-containing protein [Spirochaetaceae bacterium]|jgi:hypothetical protein|nr:PilZ domain-containing protein [Spirochaetaceae bacterium]
MIDENIGKKVFFIYPHSVIQEKLINVIVDNEYEVYMVYDHNKIDTINRIYRDSIVFINIDEGIPETEWEKIIRSFSEDTPKNNLSFGILTYNENQSLAQKYLMDIMVSSGFIRLKLGLKESIKIILKTLEANEAKGQRKYVRARPQKEDASFNFKNEDGKLIFGHINDISSVGMAITFDNEITIKKNSLLKAIQINLKGTLIKVNGVVIGSRKVGESKTIYVLIFDSSTSKEVKQKLRLYIHKLLQDDVNLVLKR